MLHRLLPVFLIGIALTGTISTAAQAASHAVVVMYHRFGEDRWPSTNIRLSQLQEHVRLLKDGGYSVLPLTEILDAQRNGRPPAR